MPNTNNLIIRFVITFLTGALILCSLSFLQKTIAGFDAFKLKAYIIPFIFGGVTGTVIGAYIFKVKDLNHQLALHVSNLEKILPICSHCKKIRKASENPRNQDSWQQIEAYISHKTSSSFTHGICPDCMEKHYGKLLHKKSENPEHKNNDTDNHNSISH